jgi:signal transduction histidine kinase
MSLRTNKRIGLTFSLKLSILYALFFIVSSMALFLVAYYLITVLVEQREREVIQARIQEYRAWYEEGGLPAIKARFDEQSHGSTDVFFTRIIGPLNQILFVSIPPGSEGFDLRQLNTTSSIRQDSWLSIRDYGKNTWTVGSTHLSRGIILQIGKNSTQSEEFLSYFRSVFFKFVVPLLLIGILIGTLLTFRAIRPIRQLIQTVRDILKTGKMSTRVPVRSERGELNELVSLFNEMLDRNDSLIQAMHESLDNVAHDLRTPMTRLRGVAELAMQDEHNPDAWYEALADSMEESERVLTMLNTLMDVAEAQTGAMRLDMVDVPVPEVVRAVVELYDIVADEKQVTVTTHLPDGLSIYADRNRIQQVLANLLDNAIKYSDSGGHIDISVYEEGDFAVISVSDQGIGIAPGEVNRIWDRLYRGDRSRSKRGLGLGLSFVQAIVQAHGGKVRVETKMNKGSKFFIMLPKAV